MSDSTIMIHIVVENGRAGIPIQFNDLSNGGSEFITSNPKVQSALESSKYFNSLFRLVEEEPFEYEVDEECAQCDENTSGYRKLNTPEDADAKGVVQEDSAGGSEKTRKEEGDAKGVVKEDGDEDGEEPIISDAKNLSDARIYLRSIGIETPVRSYDDAKRIGEENNISFPNLKF